LDYASSVTPATWYYVDVDVLYFLPATRTVIDSNGGGVGPDRFPYRSKNPV